jgi:hypothetical protein
MKHLRATIALLGLIGSTFVLASPATAATQAGTTSAAPTDNRRCYSSTLVRRCAHTTGPNIMSAWGSATPLKDNVYTRIAVLRLQRRTSDGWDTVKRSSPGTTFFGGGSTSGTGKFCSELPAGKYRSFATVKWKRGSDGTVYTGKIKSRAVRKSTLCT